MRIGILTSGGDTPGMNAVIRGALIKAKLLDHTLIGFYAGWKGLIENIPITIDDSIIDQIDLGGTVLGSGRTNPLKTENGLQKIKETIQSNHLDCVITIGGEDTLGVANYLTNQGLPMLGVPKTIDNDLDATDYTFGFNTAISIATEAIDRLKTTAKSHERVIVVEIMGRHAGWMTLHAGIAGGAHVILIPEYEIQLQQILKIIKKRYENGNKWAIIAVSEGYGYISNDIDDLETDEFGHVKLEDLGIAKKIANTISAKLSIATRSIIIGHTQRGGPPTAFDRVLSTQFGIKVVEMANESQFGMMPALRGTTIVPISLMEAVAKLKTVDIDSWSYAVDLMGVDFKLT